MAAWRYKSSLLVFQHWKRNFSAQPCNILYILLACQLLAKCVVDSHINAEKSSKILLIYFSLEADIRTAKISRLSTQLRRQLHQLRRTLRTHHYHHKDLVASGSVLVKAVSRNSSACVDSLFENSKKSRKTR